ncbi:hypothetical protein GCM10009814_09420 [Lapillicoccus jejuensis]
MSYLEPLGSGGYADVHLYQQQSPRRSVAVKVLKGRGLTDDLRRQFVAEADTMALFGNHPHIVQVFWADTAPDGRPYLVMEYYPPPHLGERAKRKPLTVQEVLRTGVQLASAVETAHRGGVVHRDIKPANVLVDHYDQPALTDFGIAGRGGADADVADTGDIGVSVPWAPPEVLTGDSNGDVAGDVYSLAATLWHLLVGRSPFAVPGGDNTQTGLTTRIKRSEVPRTGRADVPLSLERVLARGMAKDRRLRPASALAFARELTAVEQELRLPPTPVRVRDAGGGTVLEGPGAGPEDRTSVKAPSRVQAQPPTPATPYGAPAAPPAAPVGPAGEVEERTVRRSDGPSGTAAPGRAAGDLGPQRTPRLIDEDLVPPAARPAPDGPPAGPRGRPGWLVPVLAAAVVVLLVVVGVAVLRPRGAATPAAPTPSRTVSTPKDTSALGDAVYTAPTVTARASAGAVGFTWTYDGPEKGDTFRVFVGPTKDAAQQAAPQTVTTPALTQRVAAGTTRCAQVQVVRGGVVSPPSDTTCERAL